MLSDLLQHQVIEIDSEDDALGGLVGVAEPDADRIRFNATHQIASASDAYDGTIRAAKKAKELNPDFGFIVAALEATTGQYVVNNSENSRAGLKAQKPARSRGRFVTERSGNFGICRHHL